MMRVLGRLLHINRALWGFVVLAVLARVGLWRTATSPAQRFALTLERLGTTFVKLGQGLSLHRELLPDDYVAALQKLHDRVEPFGSEQARAEIEASFGRPLDELFASFDPEALAAGSIAQVHCATMPDGRHVIVKVRRPGIGRQISEDVLVLRWFVRSLVLVLPWLRELQPLALIDELARNLRREIDLRQEADAIARFARMFNGSATIYVPGVVARLYTPWVIVQERSPGMRIDDPALAAHGHALADRLMDSYLRQLLVEGVFHGDPHPGNLFVLEDGRICLHDFGLIGYLDRETRLNLVAFMLAFSRQDSEWLLDAYLDLGMLAGEQDRASLRRGIEELMQDYGRKPLRDWSLGEVLLRVTQLGGARNARVPHHLLVLMRAIFLLESTLRRLDPDASLVDMLFLKAGAMVTTLLAPQPIEPTKEQGKPPGRLRYEAMVSLHQLPDQVGAALRRLRNDGVQLTVAHRGLESLSSSVREVGGWLAQALLALGLFVGASVLLQARVGPHWREVPVLAAVGYAVATWLTVRLLRSLRRRH